MRVITTAILIVLAVSSTRGSVQDSIHRAEERTKDPLHLHHKNMPEKVKEVAEDIQAGFDHVKGAVEKGFDALTEEGIRHKIHNAYESSKDGLKIAKDAKDVTIDSQKVGLEGAKDAAKEGVHIYRKHEDTSSKLDDAKEFIKEELHLSKEAFKDGLEGSLKDKSGKVIDAVADELKNVGESLKSTVHSQVHEHEHLKEAADKIKSAVGLEGDKSDEKLSGLKKAGEAIKSAVGLDADKSDKKNDGLHKVGEAIKSAVGLGGDHDDKKQEKKEKKHVDEEL